MTGMIAQLLAWPTLGVALLVFGFAPGVCLRLIVLFYPRGNLRRRELLGELYAVPRIERPFWVAEQLEVALFEGLRDRLKAWRDRYTERRIDPFAEMVAIGPRQEWKRRAVAEYTKVLLAGRDLSASPVAVDTSRGWCGRVWRDVPPDVQMKENQDPPAGV